MSKTQHKFPIQIQQLMDAVETDSTVGFCTTCGEDHYGVEPDAENYICRSCNTNTVCGAELLLISGNYNNDSSST